MGVYCGRSRSVQGGEAGGGSGRRDGREQRVSSGSGRWDGKEQRAESREQRVRSRAESRE